MSPAGQVRGLAHGSLTGVPYLESLHVRAGHRRHGIGQELMRAVAGRVHAQGSRRLHLDVVSGNDRALRFYRRLGAVELATHPARWAPEVTETRMLIPDIETIREAESERRKCRCAGDSQLEARHRLSAC